MTVQPELALSGNEEVDRHLASQGLLCLECKSTDIICTGHHFDLMDLNACYDCKTCGNKWEGY